ncbi:hypothetical protein [Phnomibacter sp. MR]|uniref:hypothetical protein n=1 Tax=Phnomibacter sp. MR TaxID=3042318 RepID=UPI003A80BDFA
MRILLLGEYSSLYNNLAAGLTKLGHNVVLASDGDGWKNYRRDIELAPSSKNAVLRNIQRIWIEQHEIPKLKGFDIVQIINPLVFSRFFPAQSLFRKLKANNGKVFLSAVGDDYYYWQAYRQGKFRYSPHEGTLADGKLKKSVWESDNLRQRNTWLIEQVEGIIAGIVDYYIPYQQVSAVPLAYIPFPLSLDNLVYTPMVDEPGKSIVFFHGIQSSRKGFKGTDLIVQAMKDAKAIWKDKISFTNVSDLPFEEYKKSYAGADVIIDQTNLYSPAMNALTAMACGKIVMGGFSKECMAINGVHEAPMVPLEPNVSYIMEAINTIVQRKLNLTKLSVRGREYVSIHHDAVTVAGRYLQFWQKPESSNIFI